MRGRYAYLVSFSYLFSYIPVLLVSKPCMSGNVFIFLEILFICGSFSLTQVVFRLIFLEWHKSAIVKLESPVRLSV